MTATTATPATIGRHGPGESAGVVGEKGVSEGFSAEDMELILLLSDSRL